MQLETWNDNLSKDVLNFINKTLLGYTIQIFSPIKENFKPYGSGVLFSTHNSHFILTASHVAKHLREPGNTLYVRIDSDKFINIAGNTHGTEIDKSSGIDLAYIRLADEMLPYLEKTYTFLTIDRISQHTPVLGGSNYCVLGYPEKNLTVIDGFSDTGPSFFVTNAANDNPYSFYKLEKKHHIIVNMKGKGTSLLTNGSSQIDSKFYGISGGGLWYLNYDLNPDTETYSIDYRLIGILTEFKKGKYYCLIANKINLFLDAFVKIEGFNFKAKVRRDP
jgi:hypothetical protein